MTGVVTQHYMRALSCQSNARPGYHFSVGGISFPASSIVASQDRDISRDTATKTLGDLRHDLGFSQGKPRL